MVEFNFKLNKTLDENIIVLLQSLLSLADLRFISYGILIGSLKHGLCFYIETDYLYLFYYVCQADHLSV